MSDLKRTPLYASHIALGATMVDFGGWEMPIQYPEGIISEHLFDRKNCGIFDVSHMGRFIIEGKDRVKFLQRVLTSNVLALTPGRAQYCMLPTVTGGAVDDAYLYMFEEDKYMLVVNASNAEKDKKHLAQFLPEYNVQFTDVSESLSSIAVQGPEAEKILKIMSGGEEITGDKKNDLKIISLEGKTVFASKTGYTGDPIGWELFIDSGDAEWLWNRLIELGAKPTGLGARDTLRLEAGLPLYGHEMGTDAAGNEIPIFAVPLAKFAVSFDEEKGDFIAKDILLNQKENGTEKRMMPIRLIDRGVMRAGMDIYFEGKHVGWVTSGTMVPYYEFDKDGNITDNTGKRSIGFAYVDSSVTKKDIIEIDVRGRRLKAKGVIKHLNQSEPPYAKAVLPKEK
ncbi:MAG: glycine cleavage system aminomethyltransferase GcvT [Clostridia bacterium]|nr:glycine cleavage system aminomethyltransferase GcvT [Clostridia bacterium]